MKDLYISTYYLKNEEPDMTPEKYLYRAKKWGFTGVEALFHFTPELFDLVQELELKIPVGYYGVENDQIRDLDYYHRLGIKYIQSNSHPTFQDHDSAMEAVEILNRQAAFAKKNGFRIYIHNHPQDFKWDEVENQYCWETVAQNMDPEGCVFQVDIGWAIIAGVDPYWLFHKYGHMVKSMHIKPATAILGVTAADFVFKDLAPGQNPGSANIEIKGEIEEGFRRIENAQQRMCDSLRDYREIMELAEEKGCESFILERDIKFDDTRVRFTEILKDDIRFIRSFW